MSFEILAPLNGLTGNLGERGDMDGVPSFDLGDMFDEGLVDKKGMNGFGLVDRLPFRGFLLLLLPSCCSLFADISSLIQKFSNKNKTQQLQAYLYKIII